MDEYIALDIQRLWYMDVLTVPPTSQNIGELTQNAVEIENVHEDTWTLEEEEAEQNVFVNQLTGGAYRMENRAMGNIVINFTIGEYDFATKTALMGGSNTETSWERQLGVVELRKCIIAYTEDNLFCVIPCANIIARESETDDAIGIAVQAIALPNDNPLVKPEYWMIFDEQRGAWMWDDGTIIDWDNGKRISLEY